MFICTDASSYTFFHMLMLMYFVVVLIHLPSEMGPCLFVWLKHGLGWVILPQGASGRPQALPGRQCSPRSWVVWVGGYCRNLQCVRVGLAFVGHPAGEGEWGSLSPICFVKAIELVRVALLYCHCIISLWWSIAVFVLWCYLCSIHTIYAKRKKGYS